MTRFTNIDYQTQEEFSSYLTFKIGEEYFAAHVSKVLGILEVVKLTKMPNTPPYVLGVTNLRGKVLPVIDTRIKFNMSPIQVSKDTCIVVLDIKYDDQELLLGALVDGVHEVTSVNLGDIVSPPEIGGKYKQEYILGMIESGDKYIMVLNVDKIFSTEKIIRIIDPLYEEMLGNKTPKEEDEIEEKNKANTKETKETREKAAEDETKAIDPIDEDPEEWIERELYGTQENELDENLAENNIPEKKSDKTQDEEMNIEPSDDELGKENKDISIDQNKEKKPVAEQKETKEKQLAESDETKTEHEIENQENQASIAGVEEKTEEKKSESDKNMQADKAEEKNKQEGKKNTQEESAADKLLKKISSKKKKRKK